MIKIANILVTLTMLLFVVGCMSLGGTRIDNIPMYGQPEVHRPEVLQRADADFIAKATAGFGSREEASKVWWSQGERFMNSGNFDYAMRRYNQSWLLNPENYQPYWGFARVLLEQNKIDEAITHLEKAEALVDDEYQKVALLADLGTAYTYKAKTEPSYFEKANQKFEESIQLDGSYAESRRRWAYSLFEQKDYSRAWENVEKANALGSKPFSPAFMSALEAAAPNRP